MEPFRFIHFIKEGLSESFQHYSQLFYFLSYQVTFFAVFVSIIKFKIVSRLTNSVTSYGEMFTKVNEKISSKDFIKTLLLKSFVQKVLYPLEPGVEL